MKDNDQFSEQCFPISVNTKVQHGEKIYAKGASKRKKLMMYDDVNMERYGEYRIRRIKK